MDREGLLGVRRRCGDPHRTQRSSLSQDHPAVSPSPTSVVSANRFREPPLLGLCRRVFPERRRDAVLGQITVQVDYSAHLLPGFLLVALGNGFGLPGLQNAALYEVDSTDAGLASGVQNTFLQVGGSLGLSVLVSLGLRHSAGEIAAGATLAVGTTDGYALALRIAAGFAIAAAVIVAVVLQRVRFVPPQEQAVAEIN